MLTLSDIEAALQRLADARPVFHSEADFQQALAWRLHRDFDDVVVRLEYPLPWGGRRAYADLWLAPRGGPSEGAIAIELKYWKQRLRVTIGRERFDLVDQDARDAGRYDFLRDVTRVERLVAEGYARAGAVIALTNDFGYWRTGQPNTNDADFRLHEGRRIAGVLRWAPTTGRRTKRGREADLHLRGEYRPVWRPYSSVRGWPHGEFRYLILPVGQG
jgi:hypothetical protein